MAQPYAANRQLTLDDLLMGGGGGTAPVPYAAPQQAQGQGMSPAESALLEALMGGGDQAPRTAEKPNLLGQILMGLGDAGTTYASVLGNAPGVRTDSLGEYQQYLQRQKFATEQANERIAEGNRETKLRGASFLYNKEVRSGEKAEAAKALKAAQEEAMAYKNAQLDQAKVLADQDKAHDLALFNAKKEWDTKLQQAGFAHDRAIAGIRKKGIEGDELAKEDRKSLGPLFSTIGALAMTAKKNIAEGKTTPEELMALIENEVDAATLSTPEAKTAVEAYILKKMGPVLKDVEAEKMNQDLAAGSPDARDGGGPGVLQRMGSVRTPQRY